MLSHHPFSTLDLEYDIRRSKFEEGLKLNGTLQLLVYAYGVNLLAKNIYMYVLAL
jgi:hypothetical protein